MNAMEVLSLYDDTYIIDMVVRDDYYRDDLVRLIRKDIPNFDKEDQIVYSDINDDMILINAYRMDFDDYNAVSLLIDAGLSHDIACLINDEYDLSRYEEDYYL